VSGVALYHRVSWLETRVGDFGDIQRFVISLLCGDDWSVGNQREVNPWIGNQVCLELVQVHIKSPIETERGCDGGHDLTDQSVEVGVTRPLDIEVTATDVIDGLVIHHEGTVRVFQCGVSHQGGIIRLHHSSGHLWCWIHAELQLGLLAVINGKPFHQQRSETRPGSTTETVEDEESLEPGAVVSKFPDPIQHQVNDLLAYSVVTSGVVICCVLLPRHHLLRMEQLSVGSSSNLIDDSWLEVEENSSGNVFAGPSLREEGGETIVSGPLFRTGGKLSIRLDPVL